MEAYGTTDGGGVVGWLEWKGWKDLPPITSALSRKDTIPWCNPFAPVMPRLRKMLNGRYEDNEAGRPLP